MGGALIPLACDNCIPGDASGWTWPIVGGVLVALALGLACLRLSQRRSGARGIAAKVAAVAFAAGPLGAAFVASMPMTWNDVHCGSAASASLNRARPGHTLDAAQEGCRVRGAGTVRGSVAAATTAVVAGGVLAVVASVPPRRPAYA